MRCFSCDQPIPDGAEFCSGCGARRLDPSPDPLIGALVGDRYRVTRLIGEGGMGAVYEAEQRMGFTRRKVAVKVLLPELSRDPTLRRRFHAECAIIARLEHPNTVDVYDFGETAEGQLYIVMEFVRGQSLDTVAEGALSVRRTVPIVRQVCGALHEAHLQGIVHRDLKPENVFLTRRAGEADFVKLLDFGIALDTGSKKKTRLTAAGTVLGTPPYMSPEQLRGSPIDGRSDVYSLGVITYELLTGRLPFAASSSWEWAQRHALDEPTSFDATPAGRAVPEPVRAVVLSALAKRPEHRPPSARAFAARLVSAANRAEQREVDARDDSPPASSPPFARRELEVRTEAALAAPIPVPVSRRWSGAWLVAVFAAPVLALGVSVAAVAGAWALTHQDPAGVPATPAAAPPVAVLTPDQPAPLDSSSAVAPATLPVAPSASVTEARPRVTPTRPAPATSSAKTPPADLARPRRPLPPRE